MEALGLTGWGVQAQVNVGYYGDSTTYGEMTPVGDYPVSTLDPCQPLPATSAPRVQFTTPTGFTLSQRLEQLTGLTVHERAQSGQTAALMAPQFGAKLNLESFDMVILNYGINDARAGTSPAAYIANMKTMVDEALRRGLFVVVEKPTPIKECGAYTTLETYRSALDAFAGMKNVRLVDQIGFLTVPQWWQNLMADPLHPNADGYEKKAQTLAASLNAMPKWCTLVATPNPVDGGASYAFKVRSSYLSGTSPWYWYGTKNGATDASGAYAGTVSTRPTSFSFTNTSGLEGTYTRRLELSDGGQTCVTNTVTLQLMPTPTPACQLTVDKGTVPASGTWTYTSTSSLGAGTYTASFHGTKNGSIDAAGTDTMPFPGAVSFTSQSGWAGVYTRYLKVYDSGNNLVCTSNQIGVQLQ